MNTKYYDRLLNIQYRNWLVGRLCSIELSIELSNKSLLKASKATVAAITTIEEEVEENTAAAAHPIIIKAAAAEMAVVANDCVAFALIRSFQKEMTRLIKNKEVIFTILNSE